MTTIQLTVKETAENNKIYFLSDISEEQKNIIMEAKKSMSLKEIADLIGIKTHHIIKFGETQLSKPASIIEYVGYFFGRITNDTRKINAFRPKQYRNYAKTEKEQEKLNWLFDDYPDALFSAKSALKKMKQPYCCLWWDYADK